MNRASSPHLQMPQSKSAVHYLAISPPRIRITDSHDKDPMGIKLSHLSAISSLIYSPEPSSLSEGNRNGLSMRRSTVCTTTSPLSYKTFLNESRRSSLPVTTHTHYVSGSTLQPPPICYDRLHCSTSSTGTDVSTINSSIVEKDDINELKIHKKSPFPTPNIMSSSSSTDVAPVPQLSPVKCASLGKGQSSGSISSFVGNSESYRRSSSSANSSTSTATLSSSSSNYEVPEHRSDGLSISSYSGISTRGSMSKCSSIDSRRSSAATDVCNRSSWSGFTSTRSR